MPILTELSDHIFKIEIARPQKRNAFDCELAQDLTQALVDAASNRDCRCVFLHAQNGLFSAGEDLDNPLSLEQGSSLLRAVAQCPKPVIACVQGPAVGFGVTLLLACDLVYCSKSALFSIPFSALGVTPRFGTVRSLLSRGNVRMVIEKLLLSEPISALDAFDIGIITRAFDDDKVYEHSFARAQRLSRMAPSASSAIKSIAESAATQDEAQAIETEERVYEKAIVSDEAREARQAFLEHRTPNFDE